MHTPRKGIKGFSIRGVGRPIGSRSFQGSQQDFFSADKIALQVRLGRARAGELANTAARAGGGLPPATNRGGKVSAQGRGVLETQGVEE